MTLEASIYSIACVASVSVGLESKESQRKGIFGVLPARKMVREPKRRTGAGGNTENPEVTSGEQSGYYSNSLAVIL